MLKVKIMSGEYYYTTDQLLFGVRTVAFNDVLGDRITVMIDLLDSIEIATVDVEFISYIQENKL